MQKKTIQTTYKRAVLYCRVSTKEQVDEGNSLVTQERICREYALKNGYDIAQVFIEQGESAKTVHRTELQRLLAYCSLKKNNIHAVIAYKIDRISRNTDDYSHIRLLLKRYGVEIKSTSEFFENTPAGRFMENIIVNVGQFDNDVRTERSMNGMKEAMREGRYVWSAPFGYKNVRIGGKSTIIRDPQTAPIIKQLFYSIAERVGPPSDIRIAMSKNGLVQKNGNPIAKGYFYRILKNPTYCGWIKKFGEVHKGLFEPIISQEQFDQVQRVLGRKIKRFGKYRIENHDFPLRRFVTHPELGTKLTGSWAKGKYKLYPYYRYLKKGNYSRSLVESKFKEFLNGYALDENEYTDFKRMIRENLIKQTKTERQKANEAKVHIEQLKTERSALIRKNIENIISDTILKEEIFRIETKIYNLNKDLDSDLSIEGDLEEAIVFLEDFLKNPSKIWEEMKFDQKRELQVFVFPRGVTFDGETYRTPEICRLYKAKSEIIPVLSPTVPSEVSPTNNPEIPYQEWKEIGEEIIELEGLLKGRAPP